MTHDMYELDLLLWIVHEENGPSSPSAISCTID